MRNLLLISALLLASCGMNQDLTIVNQEPQIPPPYEFERPPVEWTE